MLKVDIRVVTTEHAKHFYNPAEVSVKVYDDKDEWEVKTNLSNVVVKPLWTGSLQQFLKLGATDKLTRLCKIPSI